MASNSYNIRKNKLVYYLDISKIPEKIFVKMYKTLPLFRKKQADEYVNYTDKLRCVASFLLFKKILHDQSISINYCDLVFSKNKPFVKNNLFYFNISHSGKYVMVGISHKPIGVDVEMIKNFNNTAGTRKLVFHKEEFKKYDSAKNKTLFFHKIWVKKESYAKCMGLGLALQFPLINSYKICDYYFKKMKIGNYCFSICGSKNYSIIKQIKIDDFVKYCKLHCK